MAGERGYFISIKQGDRGDTEAFIRAALDRPEISKWAFILHDKEYYNQHDLDARYYGLQYAWADGFEGIEKYSSMEEYLEEKMHEPPYIGDKMEEFWRIVIIADKKKCGTDDVAEWFGIQEPLVDLLTDRVRIADELKRLTREDKHSRAVEKHLYSDDEVKSNFYFREYITNTKVSPVKEKMKDIFLPPPRRMRKK
ncbi:MAG: hypothetical protein K6E72_04220 [Saccharofermentans sp.]|nr:hypothetical protein [Saccharofermentans sp.]